MKELNDLQYLDMVIKESLRLYPSVPMFGRKISENVDISEKILKDFEIFDFKNFFVDGFIIPKGSNVAVGPYFMARNPAFWKDPLKFMPERFESKDSQYHPYLNVPFSAGPRYLKQGLDTSNFVNFNFLP